MFKAASPSSRSGASFSAEENVVRTAVVFVSSCVEDVASASSSSSPSLRRRIAAAGDGPRPFAPFETVVVAHPEHHSPHRDAVRQVGFTVRHFAGGAPVHVRTSSSAPARVDDRRPRRSVRVQAKRLHLEVAHENDAHVCCRATRTTRRERWTTRRERWRRFRKRRRRRWRRSGGTACSPSFAPGARGRHVVTRRTRRTARRPGLRHRAHHDGARRRRRVRRRTLCTARSPTRARATASC